MADLEATDLEVLVPNNTQPDDLRCCCGNTDCLLLKQNCSILDGVERELQTAARVGQALLARHEALMASAEDERFEMQTRIDQLETDKLSLEAKNQRSIQENRALLDELEALNNSVTDSEVHIRDLEASLASSQHALRKLESQEARTAELESQLGVLETEQAELQSTLVMSQSEARSAMSRWRQAERGISDLQEQLERIEREAREERERHADMINRMEKEKHLNTAAGRLKGAAAAKTIGDGRSGGVVSHFVRDLLSDNANLQLGVAELREMLMNSNDEIQLLREQIMFHQPAEQDELKAATTLRAELNVPEEQDPRRPLSPLSQPSPQLSDSTAALSQELHIHHHYHVTKPAENRKPPKKKRQPHLTPSNFIPPSPYSPTGSSNPWRLEHRATTPTFARHSAKDSISTLTSTRWSVFSDQPSDFAPSSVPTSPMSHRGRMSNFDRDSDVPTSPTSCGDPLSPQWTRQHRSQKSADAIMRKFSTPQPLCLDDLPENDTHSEHGAASRYLQTPGSADKRRPMSRASHHRRNNLSLTENLIPNGSPGNIYHDDHGNRMSLHPSFNDDSYESFIRGSGQPQPRLQRATSQESIMSLTGGLEIHTLKARPGQLALKPLIGITTAETQVTTMVARPTIIARGSTADGKRGSVVLRDNLLMSLPNFKDKETPQHQHQQSRPPTSKKLGRFVSRLWAAPSLSKNNKNAAADSSSRSSTPTPSEGGGGEEGTSASDATTTTPTPTTVSPGSSISETTMSSSGQQAVNIDNNAPPTASSKASNSRGVGVPELILSPPRTFGINQPGAIPGFSEYWLAHQKRGPKAQIVAAVVDAEALREAVEEG